MGSAFFACKKKFTTCSTELKKKIDKINEVVIKVEKDLKELEIVPETQDENNKDKL